MARSFSGRRLRETRIAAGVSIERLALDLGRSAYSLYGYENGKVSPPVNVLAHAASLLGCKVDDLLDEEALRVA